MVNPVMVQRARTAAEALGRAVAGLAAHLFANSGLIPSSGLEAPKVSKAELASISSVPFGLAAAVSTQITCNNCLLQVQAPGSSAVTSATRMTIDSSSSLVILMPSPLCSNLEMPARDPHEEHFAFGVPQSREPE